MPFPLIPLAIGGLLGALTDPNDPLKGGLRGAALGAGGAALGGLLAPSAAAAAPIGVGSGASLPTLASEIAGTAGGLPGGLPDAFAAGNIGLPSLSSEIAGTSAGIPGGLETALQGDKVRQAAGLLPKEKSGFQQQLVTGLLSNAGSFIPQGQPAQQTPAGSLARPAFNPAQNLFLNFRRRRR